MKFPKPEQKFFDRYLENNLTELANFLTIKYSQIERAELPGVLPVRENGELWLESNSTSTVKWREYNVFQFHHPSIHKLYTAVSEMTKEACKYYEIDFDSSHYMVQGWFNINYNKTGKLDWHEHSSIGAPLFHGYYCVKAEPSETHYLINNKNEVVNINKDNRAILSETSHPHAMADWDWDGPRITIAYDVTPLKYLNTLPEQHWIPLI